MLSEKYDSASISFARAIEPCGRLGHWRQVAYSFNAIAECRIRKEDFDAAYPILVKTRKVEKEHLLSESAEAARTEELLGKVLAYQENLAEAADALNRSVDIRTRHTPIDSMGLAASYTSLSELRTKTGDFDLASRYIKDALAILAQLSGQHPIETANTLLTAGNLEGSRGEYDSGISYLSRALSLLRGCNASATVLTAQTYIWLGACYSYKGEYAIAADYQKRALDICRTASVGDASLGNCYALIGEQHANLGNYEQAVEYLSQALPLMRSSPREHHSNAATPLNILGVTYLGLKQPEKALACVNQAIHLREKSLGTRHPALCSSYKIKGDVLRRMGNPQQAMKYYRKALEIWERINPNPNRYDVITLLIAMGLSDVKLGKFDQADSLLRSALERGIRSTTRSPIQMAAARKALGDLLSKKGMYAEAIPEYQQSIINLCTDFSDTSLTANPTPVQVRNPKEIVPVLAAKAKALKRLYSGMAGNAEYLVSALRSYEAAINIGDATQRNFTSTDAKLFHEEETSTLHEKTVDLAVNLLHVTGDSSYRERAFALAEQSRAQVLLENLSETHVEHFSGIPDSVLRAEAALRSEVNSCDILIDRGLEGLDALTPERLSGLNNRRFEARTALDRLDEQLHTEYPAYFESRSRPPALRLDALRQTLEPGTALVEYSSGKSRLHIFVVKREGIQLVSVPGTNIPGDVQAFLQALKSIDQPSYFRYGARLYNSTIAPIRPYLHGITRLVVVPDGSLCYVPFEALFAPASGAGRVGKSTATTHLAYLVKDFDVTYSYSASFYTKCVARSRVGVPAESFAGFAPVFADTQGTRALLASDMLTKQTDASALRSITVDGNHFNELKYSEDEVQSIGASFRKSGMSVLQFLRGRATEEAFKQRAGSSKFVHVATHGLMNGEHPRLSGLLFSTAADGGSGNASSVPETLGQRPEQEDGILYAGETYNLKLDADLLVLSSCQSGAGKLVRGEGVMSITRGFFYAGARNIVVSLWRIYDKQTAQFMKELYNYILNGDNYARALRKAKLRMIENPSTSFPSKWAGFVLLGR